ncbi:YraN family protein [Actomonas aquatica]|uniref:UPF0102 protein K1X11_000050 n=1 Tax=Actomonas aquatica TaxID=2866162 RepID=A0ABZ1CBT9_9BACT|nr:YraN family protein [Opitutus sp. WL0086]WRQ87780.1 YraN family protein [Opitutus sp. WL0086]
MSQRRVGGNRGEAGERRAEVFLVKERGMKLVARNWRNPRDRREEIDLVMRDGEVLVFVEVKARSDLARVPGLYAIDKRKRAVLRRAIRAYLWHLREEPHTHRFDVVELACPDGEDMTAATVRHFENVRLDRPIR